MIYVSEKAMQLTTLGRLGQEVANGSKPHIGENGGDHGCIKQLGGIGMVMIVKLRRNPAREQAALLK